MKRLLSALTICAFLSLSAAASPTGTVTMKCLGYDTVLFEIVSFNADSDGVYPPYSYSGIVLAGYYIHDIISATGTGVNIDDPLMTFCIDLSQSPVTNYATFDVVPLMDAPNPTFIGSMMTTARANMLRELQGRHYSKAFTAQQAAEFQLAVWEIVFETSGTYDISNGSLNSSDCIIGTNALLSSLNGTGPMANLVALTNPCYQDMLAETAIPAPGALLLVGIGTAIVGFLRGRKAI